MKKIVIWSLGIVAVLTAGFLGVRAFMNDEGINREMIEKYRQLGVYKNEAMIAQEVAEKDKMAMQNAVSIYTGSLEKWREPARKYNEIAKELGMDEEIIVPADPTSF